MAKATAQQAAWTHVRALESTDSPVTAGEILAGKRHLTLPMIRKFNKLFGIPLEFLVRGYNQKSS